uniref:Uncharacterized protein n=1 Tax=Rhizophora mucronata TaxID=61149 RepID=A0A2P2NVQ5_RHIMU
MLRNKNNHSISKQK